MVITKNINLFKHLNHGKKSPEDKLTSYIFTTLHLLYHNGNQAPFKEFINNIKNIYWQEEQKWKLKLWPRYKDNEQVTDQSIVEPDVVYETDNFVICIECKRNGCFSTGQLNREREIWTDTRLNNRKLKLIAISDHLTKPKEIIKFNKNSRSKWQWLPWSFFYQEFSKLLDDKNKTTQFLLKSILTYMEEYNMDGFTKFDPKSLWNYTVSFEHISKTTNDIGNFIIAIDKYLDDNDLPIYRRNNPKDVYPKAEGFNHLENWVRNCYYFQFYLKRWEEHGGSHGLFILFDFVDRPIFKIGIRLNVEHVEDDNKKLRSDLINEIEIFCKKNDDYKIFATEKGARSEPNNRSKNINSSKFIGLEKEINEYYKKNKEELLKLIGRELEFLAGKEGFNSFFKQK